ncbi:MAG: thioredoxin-disulfide reductase [Spirochaetia bacterium]|jgi:thioredoxin reductase (NADPH)|nr:thioredoxin-disulfide reductase [Spirochaetia bacterium]
MNDIIIVGSGPAGHTAAIYSARAGLDTTLFEGWMAGGIAPGGQLTTTNEIENFPGFPEGMTGPELMATIRKQSVGQGVEIFTETVESVDLSKRPFKVKTPSREMEASAIIIATGAIARRMGVPNEDKFWQKGISACAVCDGALPLFRNQPLVVIGGGDTAMEEAMHLSKFGSMVYVVHRRDELRASKAMQERVLANEKITILWNTVMLDVGGSEVLEHVVLKNVKTGEEFKQDAKGLFYAIGHNPNTVFLDDQLDLDETGYILTKPGTTNTSIPGVFAAGDVQDKVYRQAVTSAGTGCMASLDAEKYLGENPL